MIMFLLTIFACGEDEKSDSASDSASEDTAIEEEAEATVRYH